MSGRSAPRFVSLGDSYTIGEGVEPVESWPVCLAALLRRAGVPVEWPQIVARTGWTTDELAAGIDAARPEGRFDLVTLMIGVNDQYRGRGPEEYRAGFRALLQRAVAFAGGEAGRVIVVSIPDWGVTPFAEGRDRRGIAAEIDRFNGVCRDEALGAGARYVDVTRSSRRAGLAGEAGLLVSDNLHPSGVAYAEWARLILPAALAALGDAAAGGPAPGEAAPGPPRRGDR